MSIAIISEQRGHGGVPAFYEHASPATAGGMA